MHVSGMVRRTIGALSIAAAGILTLTAATRRQDADIIRGNIKGPDGNPIAATVTVISATDSTKLWKKVASKADGRYSTLFNPGAGVYRVTAGAEGFADTVVESVVPRLGLGAVDLMLRKRLPGDVRLAPDLVRGTIRTADGHPALARVTATSTTDSVARSARTSEVGKFALMFPRGGGMYRVVLSADGHADSTVTVGSRADTLPMGGRTLEIEVRLRKR